MDSVWLLLSGLDGLASGGLQALDVIVGVNGMCLAGKSFEEASVALERADTPLRSDIDILS